MHNFWTGIFDWFFGVIVNSYVDMSTTPNFKIKFISGGAIVIFSMAMSKAVFSIEAGHNNQGHHN